MRSRCGIWAGSNWSRGDKGLCGALNSNLMREAAKFDKASTVYITVGRKASQFIARTKRQLLAEFTYKDAPLFSEARAISRFARDLFLKGEFEQRVAISNFRPESFDQAAVWYKEAITRDPRGCSSDACNFVID